MKSRPKLSIITVCLNIEHDIEKTCVSIVSQTNKDFEWIVVDGGSTDNTLSILKKYKKHITQLISEKDRGVYHAMNKGIRKATGEYLIFLNGGDYFYSKTVIRDVLPQLQSDIVYGDFAVRDKDGIIEKRTLPGHVDTFTLIDHCINHQSTFIKRDLFKKYGLYDTSYTILADEEKWFLFASKHIFFKKIPYVISVYKGYDGLSSSNTYVKQHSDDRWRMLEKYLTPSQLQSFYQSKIVSLEQELSDIKSTRFFKLWRRLVKLKEWGTRKAV